MKNEAKPKVEKKAREHRLTYDECRKQAICVDCTRRKARVKDGKPMSQCQQCADATAERAVKRIKAAKK